MTPSPTFLNLKLLIETQFNATIKTLQTNWGGEFRPLKPFLTNLGTIHCHPCPSTLEQNGRVERKNCDVVEKDIFLLAHASIPLSF